MKRKSMSEASHKELEDFVLMTHYYLSTLRKNKAEHIKDVLEDSQLTKEQSYLIVNHLEAAYVDFLKCMQSIFEKVCWRDEENQYLDALSESITASNSFQNELSSIDYAKPRMEKIHNVIYDDQEKLY